MTVPVAATPELRVLAIGQANVMGLDPVLVQAVVEQESAWNPWAIRFEPGFDAIYVAKLRLPITEDHARAMSWGLLQVLGEVAREFGFTGPLPSLCDPATGLRWGCAKLARCVHLTDSVETALAEYNGAGPAAQVYAQQVMARMGNYR